MVRGGLRRLPWAVRARLARNVLSPRVEALATDRSSLDVPSTTAVQNRLGGIRLALVKADTYPDLFCCPAGSTGATLAESTTMRSGPVALYTDAFCRGYIVHQVADMESVIWRQRVRDCGHGDAAYHVEMAPSRTSARAGKAEHAPTQRDFAINVEDVPYAEFDLVITFDVAVPSRIIKKYPKTTFVYYVGEPCCWEYAWSHRRPVPGYRFFLNQRFRAIDTSRLPDHVIEFPYYLQRVGCLEGLHSQRPRDIRRGILLEFHTGLSISDTELSLLNDVAGPVFFSNRDPVVTFEGLSRAKYFLRLHGRQLWGNSYIEAIASGLTVIASPRSLKNPGLLVDGNPITTIHDALKQIRELESNETEYARLLAQQQADCDLLCYRRPVTELLDRAGL